MILLEKKYTKGIDEVSNRYIEFILKATSRMQTLIKDLLDFSRVGREPSFAIIDFNKLLNEVLSDMNASIKEQEAIITFSRLPSLKGIELELKRLFQLLQKYYLA